MAGGGHVKTELSSSDDDYTIDVAGHRRIVFLSWTIWDSSDYLNSTFTDLIFIEALYLDWGSCILRNKKNDKIYFVPDIDPTQDTVWFLIETHQMHGRGWFDSLISLKTYVFDCLSHFFFIPRDKVNKSWDRDMNVYTIETEIKPADEPLQDYQVDWNYKEFKDSF